MSCISSTSHSSNTSRIIKSVNREEYTCIVTETRIVHNTFVDGDIAAPDRVSVTKVHIDPTFPYSTPI